MSSNAQIVSAIRTYEVERERIDRIITHLKSALSATGQVPERKPPTKTPAKPKPKTKTKKDTSPKGYIEASVPYLQQHGEAKVADILRHLKAQKGFVATTRPSLESSLLNESRKPTPRIVKVDAGKYGLPRPSAPASEVSALRS